MQVCSRLPACRLDTVSMQQWQAAASVGLLCLFNIQSACREQPLTCSYAGKAREQRRSLSRAASHSIVSPAAGPRCTASALSGTRSSP